MKRRIQILETQQVFKKSIFKINEARLKHELYNGEMSGEITRLNLERGDSAAVIMHDTRNDTIILTEQFRYPTVQKGPGWILEIPAGTVESDEISDPIKTLRREIIEEFGYSVVNFRKISTFYVSPGGTSERIHLFYVQVSTGNKVSSGGGIISEGEDVRVLSIKFDEALKMIENGLLQDAKTIIGLQWMQVNRAKLATDSR
ncbi:MAG: NUDIX domain-containing protein [Anaerolineae bacterium]|nr:NUDIX domain-containing protein [Anaerolineae bacterium]